MKGYVAVAMVALAATAWAQQAPKTPEVPKYAVIDVNVLVQDSAAGKEAMARLKKLQDEV